MYAGSPTETPGSAIVDIPLGRTPVARLQPFLAPDAYAELGRTATTTCRLLAGRRVWAVSSAASGGGVAELLRTLLPYWRGCGVDVGWQVVRGTPEFFRVTKRLHNWLHGSRGDGGRLGRSEVAIFDRVSRWHAEALVGRVARGDIVMLQDPQAAPLVGPLKHAGATVIWRCHIGADCPNTRVHRAWGLLLPRLHDADALVFTRPSFVPGEVHGDAHCVAPAIDPAGAKNAPLTRQAAAELARGMGVVDAEVTAAKWIGAPEVISEGAPPRLGVDPIVLSLCRWDRLKDPIGILDSFAESVAPRTRAHLLLGGPAVQGIEDDPESEEIFRAVFERWERLEAKERRRIHLLRLPLGDLERNAAMVNALQHVADVVVKKSRAEGFGLGVTEAMWKGRPVVATAVGGQRDQIEDRHTGLLVEDPDDPERFGGAVVELLRHRAFASRLGRAARESVRTRFLPDRHFEAWSRVFASALARS